jgi:DNA-binding Xre family transcriptional regulator
VSKQLRNRVMLFLQEKERNENRRISSSEVARAINVSPSTIGSWIRNEVTKIEAHVLIGLCDYFECKIEDLIYIEEVESEIP